MEIEIERIKSLLKEIGKSHEEGLISDEAYSLLKRDYEKRLAKPHKEKGFVGDLEEKVFFIEGFKIETKRGIVEMDGCHFVPVISWGKRIGGVFFGKGHYKVLHGDAEGMLEDTTLILREGFSPEGAETQAPEYLEKAYKTLKGTTLQFEADAWWIKNTRRSAFGLFGGWSCELYLSDTKVELRTPTKKLKWNESFELNEPIKDYQEREGEILFKTPTMTLELVPESLTIRRSTESIFLSSNELRVEKPANKILYRNWEEGIAPFRRKIRQDLERALEGLKAKEELEKYRFLYEGEEKGEREILIDRPASKFEMSGEGFKVESPTSKVFVGKDGKIFIRTPTSHISVPGHGGKIAIGDMNESLPNLSFDFNLLDSNLKSCCGEIERALRNVEGKRHEIEEKMARVHGIDMPPIPPVPPIHSLFGHEGHYRREGEQSIRKGIIENPSFYVQCHETIEIVGREGNEYRVKFEEDGESDFRIEGNKVYITAHEELSMCIPRNSALTIENTSGDTQIRGISGDIVIHAYSGDIEVEEIESGQLRIEADSGDISLNNVSGQRAIIESISGSVEGEVGFSECHMNLSSGDVILVVHEGMYALETASGNIEVSSPEAYSLDATSAIGRIAVAGEERGQEFHLSNQDAKVRLTLRADSGDIEVE